jgi:hypothetical protein
MLYNSSFLQISIILAYSSGISDGTYETTPVPFAADTVSIGRILMPEV